MKLSVIWPVGLSLIYFSNSFAKFLYSFYNLNVPALDIFLDVLYLFV